jgi:hypothetical protein
MESKRKTVFISYSWDGSEHQQWVLNLAKDLMEKFGVNVILDQFELSAGKDLTYFMERAIEESEKVLIILTPKYKVKAENRKSGVGYESSMISQEIFESPISQVKFIPILRNGSQSESAPKFLKSKLYHGMVEDDKYINRLYELSRIIYDKPLVEKPKLGKIPDFSKNDLDPIIDIAIAVSNEEKLNNEINSILESQEGVRLFNLEMHNLKEELIEKIQLYRSNASLPFSYESNDRDSFIISVLGYSVSFYWKLMYSNSINNSIFTVRHLKGTIRLQNGHYFPGREPKIVSESEFSMDMNYDKEIVWKSNSRKLSRAEIIKDAFMYIIESIRKEKSKNFRR